MKCVRYPKLPQRVAQKANLFKNKFPYISVIDEASDFKFGRAVSSPARSGARPRPLTHILAILNPENASDGNKTVFFQFICNSYRE